MRSEAEIRNVIAISGRAFSVLLADPEAKDHHCIGMLAVEEALRWALGEDVVSLDGNPGVVENLLADEAEQPPATPTRQGQQS